MNVAPVIAPAALLPVPDLAFLQGDLPVWGKVLVVLLASLVVAKAIEAAGYWIADAWGEGGTLRTVFFEEVTLPLYVSVFLYGVVVALGFIETQVDLSVVENVVATAILVLWSRAGIRVGDRGLDLLKDRDRSYEFAPVFKNIWSVLVVTLTFIGLLIIWRIDITPLLASAGVIGIIIGFAARDAVANFIGGIALYFDDTYKLGDFIVLETGEKGTVVDIGLRSTTLLTRDRVMITVPNSVLNNAHVVNESAPQRYKRIKVPVSVAYGTDLDRVEEILLDLAEDVIHVRETPQPKFFVGEFGDNGIQVELRAFIPHPTRESRAIHTINREIYERFSEAGISIPFPQRDVHMRGGQAPGPAERTRVADEMAADAPEDGPDENGS